MDTPFAPLSDPVDRVDTLSDGLGRRFEYLRLSLTEVCNFRCQYCLPNGFRRRPDAAPELTLAEIRRAVAGFAALGLWRVRLTGGEPTLRADCAEIVAAVKAVPGVRHVAMTTNGYRLGEKAAPLRAAGLDSLNVSVDTLDPARFAAITGHDRLAEILAGVETARGEGLAVKLNAVLMEGINADELAAMAAFVCERDLTLRFIEVMAVGDRPGFHTRHYRAGAGVVAWLREQGWRREDRAPGAGPARTFVHPSGQGRIGVIAPYAADFCASCNRLRLSAEGKLHLCLFGDGGLDLRDLLQADDQHGALVARIRALTATKAPAHRLAEGNSGATPHLASIGG